MQAKSTPLRGRYAFVAFLAVVVAFHLISVTAAALPTNGYSQSIKSQTNYLNPYFAQNWRLFAPNPVSADRSIRFQAAYESDGKVVLSDWVDWTDVELDLVRHRLVGNRAGYITSKGYTSVGARYRALNRVQKAAADIEDPEKSLDWEALPKSLAGENPRAVRAARSYVLIDKAFTELATAVMSSRLPGKKFVAIRYAMRSQDVTPYASRSGTAKERERSRPPATERKNGWRQPVEAAPATRDAIIDFDRRHRRQS